MKRRNYSLLFALLVLGLLESLVWGQDKVAPDRSENVAGQATGIWDSARAKTCSVATLKGAYGILLKGVIVNIPGVPSGPTASVGIITYDGAGNYASTFTTNFNGFILEQQLSGTYTINSNCTGRLVSGLATAPLIIIDEGREVRSLQAYPAGVAMPPGAGWVIEAVGKKIAPAINEKGTIYDRARTFYCTPGNVAGEYAVTANGMVLNAPPFPAGPALGLSRVNLNDAGQSVVEGTFNFNGMIVPITDTATGTSLNSDCTSTAVQTSNGAIQKTVFVNGGTEFFFLQLPPAGAPNVPGAGIVFWGEGRRIHR